MKLRKKKLKDFEMYLIEGDKGISAELTPPGSENVREKAFMTLLKKEMRPGMIACDIGANIGFVTLTMASTIGKTGKIIAIEPDEQNSDVLKKNLALNGYDDFVDVYNMAISDKDGTRTFYRSPTMSNLGGMQKSSRATDPVEMETRSITSLMKELGVSPSFFKMDIEGHEVEALEGMVEYSKDNKEIECKILMEVHPVWYSEDHCLEKSIRALLDEGYYFKALVSAGIANPKAFRDLGYNTPDEIHNCGWVRGIYYNVDNEHALQLTCHLNKEELRLPNGTKAQSVRAVRSILLEKPAIGG